jgi:hypothetical protein
LLQLNDDVLLFDRCTAEPRHPVPMRHLKEESGKGLHRGPGFLGLGGLRVHSATCSRSENLFPTDLQIRQGLGDPASL